jgi:apolipoprotein N-acyltransferase
MNKFSPILLDSMAAIMLGILLSFAFAPYGIFPLAVLAPAGLLALWLKVAPSAKQAFRLGYLFGLGLFGSGVYWVFTSIHVIGGVPTPLAALITAGMVAILALFPACAGYLSNHFFPLQTTEKLLYAFPAIWVFIEWIRSWLFTGFPWLFLGYSQTNSPLKGFAPILSVYGVSLALTISSGLLVNAALQYKRKKIKALCFNLLAIAIIWGLGGLLSYIPWTITQGKPISVSLVQGNIPQTLKWSPEHLQLSLDRYTQLTEPLWGKSNIIIWPESAIPLPLQNAEEFINALDKKAQESGSSLILGIPIRTQDNQSYYNSIITLGSNKHVYNKRHLVPFGEYIPLTNLLNKALQFMDIPMSEMREGNPLQQALIMGDIKILPSICYEIAFPDLMRNLDKSINMLLVLTNDAWFGESNAEAQHLQMAAMRALEFHKPVLFASNDGITAVIDPNGKTEASLAQREIAILSVNVQPMYGSTPWLVNGIDPLLFILIILLIAAALANKTAARLSKTSSLPDNKMSVSLKT